VLINVTAGGIYH